MIYCTHVNKKIDIYADKDGVLYNYTVKKIYRIPVFFFTKPFRNGKTPMLTRDFWCPPEKEFFVF